MKTINEALKNSISLGEAISAIQDELIESQQQRQRKGKPILFETDRLTLEAHCVFTQKSAAHAGIELKLLSLFESGIGGELSGEESMVQKLTIEFKAAEPQESAKSGRLELKPSGRFPKNVSE